MTTTVTITIEDHASTIFGRVAQPARTEIAITRDSKLAAIAEALTMCAAAHLPEMKRAWADLRPQLESLLETYQEPAAEPAEPTATA